MRIVWPFEADVTPKEIDKGTQWLTARLKNIGLKTVTSLDVKLHSLDTYGITVLGTGEFIYMLKPKEEQFVSFQVIAESTAKVYGSVSGYKDGEHFYVESPTAKIKVGQEVAELESVFAMTEPYTAMGKIVKLEARVKGLSDSSGLDLEFWAEDPVGEFRELQRIEIKQLAAGQEARYTTEITPKDTGFYTIHGYLYDKWRKIDHKTDNIWVTE